RGRDFRGQLEAGRRGRSDRIRVGHAPAGGRGHSSRAARGGAGRGVPGQPQLRRRIQRAVRLPARRRAGALRRLPRPRPVRGRRKADRPDDAGGGGLRGRGPRRPPRPHPEL
ncbi:MAG: hypothetical protein AVDCRST_MAG69-1553, partial [uncultured Solirubrobacteraceae bacterium]